MKKTIFHSALSVMLAFSLILMTLMTGVVALADGETALLSIGTVEEGDTAITVHCGATGAKDWFHIFPAGFTSSSQNLGSFKYCSANGDVTYTLDQAITAGDYVVVLYLRDDYEEGGRFPFTVEGEEASAEDPILAKEVYGLNENIAINWNAVPAEVGWAAVYARDYDGDLHDYGDYINRGAASFPSGVGTRYKSLSWPLRTGDYKVVFFTGSGYTVNSTVDFSVETPTVSLDKESVKLCHKENLQLSVTGGLNANTYYRVRLYKAKEGFGPSDSFFGSFGVTFNNTDLIGDANGITTDANGAGTATENLHQKITEPGMYAYCIMTKENYSTKAVAFFEVTPAAAISLSRTSIPCGANVPLMLNVTAGDDGLLASHRYNVRLYHGYNGITGFGSGDVNTGAGLIGETTVTTDANGAASLMVTSHIAGITETGKYVYAIMDGWDTVARAYFDVTDAVEELGDDFPQVKLNKTSIPVGSSETLELTVTNATELGMTAGKYYYVRLYKAKAGYGPEKTGFGTAGFDQNVKIGDASGITLDANGSKTVTESLHITKITEPGMYVYVVMDGWNTKAVAFFEVTKEPGDVNNDEVIDVCDLIRLKKILAEEADFTMAADVNNDTEVDILDLIDMRAILLAR